MNIIETKSLCKTYEGRKIKTMAVRGIDFTVKKGDFTAIMGPSGAGKTTLLNLLASIDTPTSGQVLYEGQDLHALSHKELAVFRRDHLGFLFQDFNLLNSMTVADNITLPLCLRNMAPKEIKERLSKTVKRLGIEKEVDKYPYELSGGQKQRVAAARAIIGEPRVILADEPTGMLDSKSATTFLHYLKKLNEELGATIIMVTHDAYTASFTKDVVFIRDGNIHTKLTGDGNRQDFYNRILDLLAAMGGGLNEVE